MEVKEARHNHRGKLFSKKEKMVHMAGKREKTLPGRRSSTTSYNVK